MTRATTDGHTRRTFIRGIAATGASTAAAATLDRAGIADLFGANAAAAEGELTPFSQFAAIAPSSADEFRVPDGYRADVLMRHGDVFRNTDGTVLKWGYNNDYLAFMPLDGKTDEGLLFSNHEYPDPFFLHGNTSGASKTPEQVAIEQESVGNSVLHVKRDATGVWAVVSPSPYNRRITGNAPEMPFTGPLAGNPAYPGIGETVRGSVANCSGGITPWGTVLSCEENYQDYAVTTGSGYGWTQATAGTGDYVNGDGTAVDQPAKYGWVVEHDPYDPSDTGRKHTALGRFRHENTAFRHVAGKPFVLYMGDDKADEGIYKFVSTREFRPGQDNNNRLILTDGELYIARFEPQGRRTFAAAGDTTPTSPTAGVGTWVQVLESELADTAKHLRARLGTAEYNQHFATNRPEDVEVHSDGTVYVALTNNTGSAVRDSHGSVRKMVETANDPTALTFAWEDYAAGGPRPTDDPTRKGFSSPDNLVFDSQENLWVVTDISSSRLNKDNEYEYHANNAMFMVPTRGPNAGVAFRFANGPVEAELTGPYFTPDERTLFINVQHPGEESGGAGVYGDASTYTSWWPMGSRTAGQNPSEPKPSLVAVTKLAPSDLGTTSTGSGDDGGGTGAGGAGAGAPVVPPPVPALGNGADPLGPRLNLLSPGRQRLAALRGQGFLFELIVDEPCELELTLRGRLRSAGRGGAGKGRGRLRSLAATSRTVTRPGTYRIRLRPGGRLRLLLGRETALPALLHVRATDSAGNVTTRTKEMTFR